MHAPPPFAMTWPRLGVLALALALALALSAAEACVIGPKPDDPATTVVDGPDADKLGDDGSFDYVDAAGGDSATLPPATDAGSDTGTLNGGGGCDAASEDGADAPMEGGCAAGDAAPEDAGDAAPEDAGGDAVADDVSADDAATEGG